MSDVAITGNAEESKLDGAVAVVTGGARGIGKAICTAFAEAGALVFVADLDLETAKATARDLPRSQPRDHIAAQVDVSDSESVGDLFAHIREACGRLDVLVNNAGICPMTPFDQIAEDEWDRVMAVNLKGAFLCCKGALSLLKESAPSRVINISSVSGKMGSIEAGAHYAASKAGLNALTWCFARTYASSGITANAIAPTTVETDMTSGLSTESLERLRQRIPLGRIGRPEDVAAAALFLASPGAAYITGEVLDVNGGFLMD